MGRYASSVADFESLHSWLFNVGVGLLLGIVGWYSLRNAFP